MNNWIKDAVFYHIYTLGFCGAPEYNDFSSVSASGLLKIIKWIPHMKELGVNVLYLGPLFESVKHGYDTVDYYKVDRRLGTNEMLKEVVHALHENGIRVVLDGVFNHVGREFFAFKDMQHSGRDSAYSSWFHSVNFDKQSPFNDPFSYQGWDGHYDLVKLNLDNDDVRKHLFDAVALWIHEFGIDGLRLDAADVLDPGFMRALSEFTSQQRDDFWLMGEVVHGDYTNWIKPDMLHSVTNYECYKGLFSSLNDKNYFEIAYALKRQFGEEGVYRNIPMYNFADNHDVNRVATRLANEAYLYPLYMLLFTMPGVPSLYYGSEWGLTGKKEEGCDAGLRPELKLAEMNDSFQSDLTNAIKLFAAVRKKNNALKYGTYREVLVDSQQLIFERSNKNEQVFVALNAEPIEKTVQIHFSNSGVRLIDLLDEDYFLETTSDAVSITIPPHWGRMMQVV